MPHQEPTEAQAGLDGRDVVALLYRRDVAMARHRAALARTLGLSEVEVAAVLHLAHRTELTTARIAALLDLSSGGATALVQRLERLGVATRRPHPDDGRSSLIRLTAKAAAQVARAEAPLTRGIEQATATLSGEAQAAVRGFLERLAELSETLTRDDDAAQGTAGTLLRPVPSLWA